VCACVRVCTRARLCFVLVFADACVFVLVFADACVFAHSSLQARACVRVLACRVCVWAAVYGV
jgi:hypothetical protein